MVTQCSRFFIFGYLLIFLILIFIYIVYVVSLRQYTLMKTMVWLERRYFSHAIPITREIGPHIYGLQHHWKTGHHRKDFASKMVGLGVAQV